MSNTIACSELTPMAADPLLTEVERVVASGNPAGLELHLGRLEFVGPYGLVLLCLIGRYAGHILPLVKIRAPEAPNLRSYLRRVRLPQALEGVARLSGDGWELEGRPENPQSRALLELTPIAAQKDVEAALGRVAGQVEAILAIELGYGEVEVSQFKNVVAELAHNIIDHSGSTGFVTAQRYADRDGRRWVEIGVGDLGVGIRASLNERFESHHWSHGESIRQSLRRDVSRGQGRGLGLYVVNRICGEYDGSLHIRSGDARVYVRRGTVREARSGPFPGTQICISLGERGSGDAEGTRVR